MVQHRRMLAPINSIKHIVQRSNANITTGAKLDHPFATAVAKGGSRSSSGIVEEGCVIKAVHLEYWICGVDDANTTQFTFIFYKLPSGTALPSAAEMSTLSSWQNKKNIFFTSQGVLPKGEEAQSIPVVREWIKIPKGKQRMGLADDLAVTVLSVGIMQFCGVAIYKEYE